MCLLRTCLHAAKEPKHEKRRILSHYSTKTALLWLYAMANDSKIICSSGTGLRDENSLQISARINLRSELKTILRLDCDLDLNFYRNNKVQVCMDLATVRVQASFSVLSLCVGGLQDQKLTKITMDR